MEYVEVIGKDTGMISAAQVMKHFSRLGSLPMQTEVTDVDGGGMLLDAGFNTVIRSMLECDARGGTTWFIGNGGSAGICSHMATDFTKNGGVRCAAFNDASLLTCFANDFGYENVFSEAIQRHAALRDVVMAISSSGESTNILRGSCTGRTVFTFSGFSRGNKLRSVGDVNFYVPAQDYGSVEITHLALLHGILDLMTGDKNG